MRRLPFVPAAIGRRRGLLPSGEALTRLAATIALMLFVSATLAGDSKPEDASRYVRALFVSSDAHRTAEVLRGSVRMIVDKGKPVSTATDITDIRSGAFMLKDALFLLSGFDKDARPRTALVRVSDGIDLCRSGENDDAAAFAELASALSVPSTDGQQICRVTQDGSVVMSSASDGRHVRRTKPDATISQVLAFAADEWLLAKLSSCEIARIRVADGKVVWRTRLRRVAPGVADSELASGNGDVQVVMQAFVLVGAERVIFEAASLSPRWGGLIALTWEKGIEEWRRDVEDGHVFVVRHRRLVGVLRDGRVGLFRADDGGDLDSFEVAQRYVSAIAIGDDCDRGYASGLGLFPVVVPELGTGEDSGK